MTLTGEQLQEVVDRACSEARRKADEAEGLRVTADEAAKEREFFRGALRQSEAQNERLLEAERAREVDRAASVGFWWAALSVGVAFVVGGGVGFALGR